MIVDKMTVDEIAVSKISAKRCKRTVDEMSFAKMTVDKMTVDEMSVGKMSAKRCIKA